MKNKIINALKTLCLLPLLSVRYLYMGIIKGEGIKHLKYILNALFQILSLTVNALQAMIDIDKRGAKDKLSSFNIRLPTCATKSPLFSHAGNAGDIVFSCVLLKSIWLHTGKKSDLHLRTDVPTVYVQKHPLKNMMMNHKIANQLIPALKMQPYIGNITIGPELPAEAIKLDAFREFPLDLKTGLIQGWYQLYTDQRLNIFEPWIHAEQLPEYKNTIVVSRTTRMRSDYINYKFLVPYANEILFVGVPDELTLFEAETGIKCKTFTANNFDVLFNIINSCRLFIGNQGFPYSIAESVQCPRVLESNSIAPNNYPMSANGRIALFQEQFENSVKGLLNP